MDADALFDQYENEKSRLLQKYMTYDIIAGLKNKKVKHEKFEPVRNSEITTAIKPAQLAAIAKLNDAKDVWRTFLSKRTFSMVKCKRLVRETKPAVIVKESMEEMRRIVEETKNFNPLELIDRDEFDEKKMFIYIDRYKNEAAAQFDVLFESTQLLLETFVNLAKTNVHKVKKGSDVANYKTLQILVDSLNTYGWKLTED